MAVPNLIKKYTVEQYFAFEESSEVRHEFHNGELFVVAGTTKTHNVLVDNIKDLIKKEFRPRDCQVFSENVKVEVEKGEENRYVYPDIVLTCHEFDKQDDLVVRYPSLIVEVLSKGTAEYDRGLKFKRYQKLPTLKYYLLVEQDPFSVELFSRTDVRHLWTYQIFTEADDIISFPIIDFSMKVSDIL
jgi:Uma2 family endonuclease